MLYCTGEKLEFICTRGDFNLIRISVDVSTSITEGEILRYYFLAVLYFSDSNSNVAETDLVA